MPTKERYHRNKRPPIPRPLSAEDKKFIQLLGTGMKRPDAFKEAYPNHQTVKKFMDLKTKQKNGEPVGDGIRKTRARLRQHSKDKVNAKYVRSALVTYQNRMDEYSELSLDTAIELVQSARSEKVRADLAIEGMRHKVGTPVQKVAVQEKKTVTLTFAKPAELDIPIDDIVEGEVV